MIRLRNLTLAGRADLAQHFLYSASIQILSDNELSFAVGEWKEMSDTLQGGSGFSFVDLLADQTGISMVKLIEIQPEKLQQLAPKIQQEAYFFPNIHGLPEGLSEQQFATQYQHNQSPRYQQMQTEIKRRLNVTRLYQEIGD